MNAYDAHDDDSSGCNHPLTHLLYCLNTDTKSLLLCSAIIAVDVVVSRDPYPDSPEVTRCRINLTLETIIAVLLYL